MAGDVFFGLYLAAMVAFTVRVTPDELREHARAEDEGIPFIVLITLAATCLSFVSIFEVLNQSRAHNGFQIGLSVASIPLVWLTFHTVAAFHYANLFYAKPIGAEDDRDAGGLSFPDTSEPGAWEFLYYSFVIGMTAQVSDVQVLDTRMRRVSLAHGVASFFFNTVILALAVSAIASRA